MKPEPPERPLKLGITPVGFSVIGIFVALGLVMGLTNLVMALLRWLDF